MARFIPAIERIKKASQLIQKARDLPIPAEGGKYDFSYIARVKATLQDARDLVKFIQRTPSATQERKEQVLRLLAEIEKADKEILH
jgi:hypothetical protein